jgi:hypothetical protein
LVKALRYPGGLKEQQEMKAFTLPTFETSSSDCNMQLFKRKKA